MYQMTDLLLQMAYGTAWELPTVSSGTSSSSNGASSFQTLLEQRKSQESASSTPGSTVDSSQKTEGESDTTVPQTQEETNSMTLDLAALGAALLMDGQTQTIVTPETLTAEPVAPVVEPVQTAVPEQADMAESVLPQAVTQEQMPQTLQTEQTALKETAQPLSEAPQPAAENSAQPLAATQEADSGAADSLHSGSEGNRQEQTVEVTQTPEMPETPVFQKVEHLPIKVGEAVTVDTTAPAQEMEASLSKILGDALKDGGQRLEIQLSPANLGTVTAEFIRSPEGALQVVLRAESPHAAKLLSDHAGSLGLLLQESTRTEVRVDVPQPQQNQQLWQENRQGGQQQQQSQQQQNQQPRQETESFLHQLRLGLLQMTPSGS